MSLPPPPPPLPPPSGGYVTALGPMSPAGEPLAGPWRRIVARLIDAIVVGFVFGSVVAAIVLDDGDTMGLAGFGAEASFAKRYSLDVADAALGFVWFAVCSKLFGGSPGKLLLRLRVVRADTGGAIGWTHAIVRWAVPAALVLIPLDDIPGAVGVLTGLASLVLIFARPLRQAVWDLAAKTLVVRTY